MINNLNIKRQLLADLLAGKTNGLQTYRSQQQASIYTRIIDERPVGGVITAYLKEGGKRQMSKEEFEQLPNKVGIWTIQDFTGGKPVPGVDEELQG